MKRSARKLESVNRPREPLFTKDSSDETSSAGFSDDEQAEEPPSGTERLDTDDENDSDTSSADDLRAQQATIDEEARRSFSPPTLEYIDSPPRITRQLTDPLLVLAPLDDPGTPASGPSDELVSAIEWLTLSSVRMQKTRQLPFLLRNLRTGFRDRCRRLGIPTDHPSEDVNLVVLFFRLDFEGNVDQAQSYKATCQEWVCPFCELQGVFDTREMLSCHLDWDHVEVKTTWTELNGATVRISIFKFTFCFLKLKFWPRNTNHVGSCHY